VNEVLIDEILNLMPHRYPFVLIDRVTSCASGQSIHAIKNVSINEPYFMGHFPNKPVVPGVLIIESMAQAAGILMLASSQQPSDEQALYLLAGVDRARFKQMVLPGDQMHLYLNLDKERQGVALFSGEVKVLDEVVCSASLLLAKRV
jgi:3-hydroxyacyl-[acyl-carrier-protein] dehydratase